MKRLTLAVLLLPMLAWADIAPDDPATLPSAACVGRQEGATCGVGGTCVKRTVSRPDFTSGTPPRWIKVDVMVCVEPSQSYVIPVALVLALLLFLGRRLALTSKEGRSVGKDWGPDRLPGSAMMLHHKQ